MSFRGQRPQALRAPSTRLGLFLWQHRTRKWSIAAATPALAWNEDAVGIAKSASRIDADVTRLVRQQAHGYQEWASTTNPLSTIFTAGPRWSIETRDLSGRRRAIDLLRRLHAGAAPTSEVNVRIRLSFGRRHARRGASRHADRTSDRTRAAAFRLGFDLGREVYFEVPVRPKREPNARHRYVGRDRLLARRA